MRDLDLIEIGGRLRSLRGRLTQAEFADQLGVERKTIGRYESGERAPDAVMLLRLMTECGADPAWILTGQGTDPVLNEDERQLLALFRSAPLTGKMAAVGALQGVISGTDIKAGAGSQVATGSGIVQIGGKARSRSKK